MKTVLLAGGKGTRLAEQTGVTPKPMLEIGDKPILWHIMNIYAACGHRDFVVACGYKGHIIKEYFQNFFHHNSDYTVDLSSGEIDVINNRGADWTVTVIDTGPETQTGGRLKRLKPLLGDERFMLTYGDGVGNIDLDALIRFHESHGKLATVTAVRPPARFGALVMEDGRVREFAEKPQTEAGWINGGFFVFEPRVIDYVPGDDTSLEAVVLERLAAEGELMAYLHEGFWQPMDTLREMRLLGELWASGAAPWKTWS